jgi:DNA polymerase III alpha subunit
MTGGLKDSFVKRHLGLEAEEHIHPSLAHLLSGTYGVILYQEQVLRIASELAGLSLSDADLLRRAMSHFDPGDRMKTLRKRFVEGAKIKSGVPEKIGDVIWDMMAAFAGYGFPKAHAASYAEVAWKSIWCKAHYPAEFMAAVLAAGGGYYRQYVYISEARRMGIEVLPPHINHSIRQFSCRYPEGIPTLYMGLDQVRKLSSETQKKIINRRPYKSLSDFLTRVNPKPQEATNLIKIGALTGYGTIPDLLNQIESDGWQPDQLPLFPINRIISGERWSLVERFDAQNNILGIGLESHPVSVFADRIAESIAQPICTAKLNVDSNVYIIGVQKTLQRFHSTEFGSYYQIELDDPTGVMAVRLSPQQYREFRNIFSSSIPFLVGGPVKLDPLLGMIYLDTQEISSLHSIQK